jgi:hypothetical protein
LVALTDSAPQARLGTVLRDGLLAFANGLASRVCLQPYSYNTWPMLRLNALSLRSLQSAAHFYTTG